ncbi:MAG TPA: amidohydrolase [Candidatus Hydrothermia bacterium]|nr:amidohydrolase [Candidatus Hydrothermae bacterium]MDD3648861.1 amidohydrolase [Candidatus Hydrothermia bacterium]MDD5572321.1 amidohydrolase [Candidatus Hydrothermia bacterium]HOK23102.1 amidohydrolase [Candidatus Hydrothermia bacterium]HOL23806.1 amidohydrolase [Candidatus Hydrothermia bacterium]
MSERIVLKARYILISSEEKIENGFVIVSNGLIEKTGKAEELKVDSTTVTFDFGDAIICPGFINTHTHAAMVGMRGMADDLPLKTWLEKYVWPTELKLVNRDFISKTVPLALAEMISSGTTTFVDMYFFEDLTAEIVKDVGMRAVLGEGIIDGPTPAFESSGKTFDFVESFIQNYEKDEFIYPAVAPHAPYTTDKEALLKSANLAEKYGVPLLIHVAETQWEFEEIKKLYGLSPFSFLESIGFLNKRVISAHSVWVDESEFDIIKRREVNISHNPESNAKLASGIAPLAEFLKKGINVCLGTDGACSNNNLDIIEEMRTASFLQKVKYMNPESLSARELFKIATENGARALGLEEKLGTLDPGKWADLIVIDLESPGLQPVFDPYSHIVYASKSADVKATMVNGRFLYMGGEFQTIALDTVLHNIKGIEKLIRKEIFNEA